MTEETPAMRNIAAKPPSNLANNLRTPNSRRISWNCALSLSVISNVRTPCLDRLRTNITKITKIPSANGMSARYIIMCKLLTFYPANTKLTAPHKMRPLWRKHLIAGVRFVNLFELFDGFVFFAHAFENGAEVVNQILLFLVERRLFLDGVLQRARGDVEHLALGKTLREITHGSEPLVRILLRLLKFLDGFADFSRLKIKHAHLKPDGEVGRIFFHAFLAFGDLKFQFLRLEFFHLRGVLRLERIELLQLSIELLHFCGGDGLVKRRIVAHLGTFEAFVKVQRAVELFFLRE